jgi:hypothetical protein
MLNRLCFSLALLLSGFTASPLAAGHALDYYLPTGTDYSVAVPTPEEHFGFPFGEWHLSSHQLDSYLRAIAAAAPTRVQLEVIGRSHEHKPLHLLIITSPENHARLDDIRREHLARWGAQPPPADRANGAPVIVSLGYGVHGNEPSAMHAAVLIAYHLAAAQGPEHDALLQSAVVLIEPLRNPDGSDRSAQWFNQHKSLSTPSADPLDREHNEGWPGGRFNHYWFDPNRDWLPLVHPGARARADNFHQWRPHVSADYHEMGTDTTYFFQPGIPSRNNPSIPAAVVALHESIAAFHREALDAAGVLYFSRERFDDFYAGKGSTYPDLHGSVGILFEQASSRGHRQDTPHGLLTFPITIRNQVLTSLSTLRAAATLRPELLHQQRSFVQETAAAAAMAKTRAYVFSDDGDPARAQAFLDLLLQHRIEVRPLLEPVTAAGHEFKPGTAWVALTNQAQFRLLTEMFIERTEFADEVFYDVSAWTLPRAFNLPFAGLPQVPRTGAMLSATPSFPQGALIGGHSDYAYLLDWRGHFAARALQRLHRAGILVKGLTGSGLEVLAADGSRGQLAPGAVLVPVGLQPEKASLIREVIERIVQEDAVTVYGCTTGGSAAGVDLGSSTFVTLKPARVALITGAGVNAPAIGAAWHLLDQRAGLTPTLLDHAQLGRAPLAGYHVIVFADGAYESAIGDATVAELKRWVREGGTLVLMGGALTWAAKKELAALEFITPGHPAPGRLPYGNAAEVEALKLVAGSIFDVSIDPTHPLGFGFASGRLALCRNHTIFLKPSKSPYETPAVYADDPLLAGYASAANQKAVAGSAAAMALSIGRGSIVALPDDPNFRGFWHGGNRLFLNAVFHGRAIRPVLLRSESGSAAE